jgi:hypothetical protein
MSKAFTDTTENGVIKSAAPGTAAGRHRGPVARDDKTDRQSAVGLGRHRRATAQLGPGGFAAPAAEA